MKSIACCNYNFLLCFSKRLFFRQQVFFVFAFIAREPLFDDPISYKTISMNQRYLNSCFRRPTVNGVCNASPTPLGFQNKYVLDFLFLFVSNYARTYICIAPIYPGASPLSEPTYVLLRSKPRRPVLPEVYVRSVFTVPPVERFIKTISLSFSFSLPSRFFVVKSKKKKAPK